MNLADAFLGVLEVSTSYFSAEGAAFVGAVAAQLPNAHNRANQRSIDRLRVRIRELEDRLDAETVEKDEFLELAKSTFLLLDSTQYEEKANAAIEIFLNGGLKDGDPEKRPYDELDHFSCCLRSLSIGALRVLSIAVALNLPAHKSIHPGEIAQKYGELDDDFCIGLLRELEGCHFIHLHISNAVYNGKRSATFGTTDLGFRFHKYILSKALEKTEYAV